MTGTVDIEQLQTKKSEKPLALVLAVFLLIGGVWAYQEVDDWVPDTMPLRNPTASEQRALAYARPGTGRGASRPSRGCARRAPSSSCGVRPIGPRSMGRPGRRASRALSGSHRSVRERACRPAGGGTGRDCRSAGRQCGTGIDEPRPRRGGETGKNGDFPSPRCLRGVVFVLIGYVLLSQLRDRGSRWFPLSASVVRSRPSSPSSSPSTI